MYKYKKKVNLEYSKAVEKTKQELKKQGFGVITEINVKKTLKDKINVDFNNYLILGACNPSYAYKALNIEYDVGLFLPCNVIIYQKEKDVFVSAILPTIISKETKNKDLEYIALEIEKKLKYVINNI